MNTPRAQPALHTCTLEYATHIYLFMHTHIAFHVHLNTPRTHTFVLISGSSCMHTCTHDTHIILFSFLVVHTFTHEYMTRTYVWFCSLVPHHHTMHAHVWSHFWFFMHAHMNTSQAYPGFHACTHTRQRAASLQRSPPCLTRAYIVCVPYMHA